jgi:hypothetical protein
LRLGYSKTLAQSCVCASAGIIKSHAVPGVPQASGEGISGLPAHSTRSSLPGVPPAPDLWNAVVLRIRFRVETTGLGLDSSWVSGGIVADCRHFAATA